jgi:hypothetical protein
VSVSSVIGSSVEEGEGKVEFPPATPVCECVSSGSAGITGSRQVKKKVCVCMYERLSMSPTKNTATLKVCSYRGMKDASA